MQDGSLQLGHRVIEASRHQKTLDSSPDTFNEVQVRTVCWQVVELEPFRFPIRPALLHRLRLVEGGVVHNHQLQASCSRPPRPPLTEYPGRPPPPRYGTNRRSSRIGVLRSLLEGTACR